MTLNNPNKRAELELNSCWFCADGDSKYTNIPGMQCCANNEKIVVEDQVSTARQYLLEAEQELDIHWQEPIMRDVSGATPASGQLLAISTIVDNFLYIVVFAG